MSSYRQKALNHYEEVCNACGSEEQVEIHHIDGDRGNNDISNLIPLCSSCHKGLESRCQNLERDFFKRPLRSSNPLLVWLIRKKRWHELNRAVENTKEGECGHPLCSQRAIPETKGGNWCFYRCREMYSELVNSLGEIKP